MGGTPEEDGDTATGSSSVNSSAESNSSSIPGTETIMVTGGYDHIIKLWHIHTSLCVKTFQHPESQINALAINPDRRLVAAAGFQQIRIYDIHGSSENPTVNFEGISKNVTTIGFNKDGTWMYSGGEDYNARIWDMRASNPQCQKVYQTHAAPITWATLHPDNTELIISDQNGTIHVWDLRNDQTEQLIPDQTSSVPVQCVAIDPLGKFLAAVNNKGDCYIWKLDAHDSDPLRLSPHQKMKVHNRYALKCCFSPDSRYLATTSADQTAKIWNAKSEDFNLAMELSCTGQRWVWDCAFTGDSQYLVTASSENVSRLWCLENRQVKREYTGHQKPLTSVAYRDPSI